MSSIHIEMKKLNILDLHRSINEKKDRMAASFEKVLEMSHRKIVNCTNQKKMNCYFEVPRYVFGYPLFDLNECIEFVQRSLKSNGFFVEYHFPNILYISWDFDEIDRTKKMSNMTSTPSGGANTTTLMPLSKNASGGGGILKYKPSGKIELNLL